MAETYPGNICPVIVAQKKLFPENKKIVDVYYQAQGSSSQVDGKDKTYSYLKPTEIESLMRIHNIPKAECDEVLTRLFILQDIANDRRLRRKKPKQTTVKHR